MAQKILIKFIRRENDLLIIRTVSRNKKYSNDFYTYTTILKEALKGRKEIIDRDGYDFACFRYDHGLHITFFWLQEGGNSNLAGQMERIYIMNPQKIIDWYDTSDQPVYSMLNEDPYTMPKIQFEETGRKQLRRIIENPAVRRKFVKAIRNKLIPGYTSKIMFFAEEIPYSFCWMEEKADGTTGMVGGLILHDFNPRTRKGYYSYHS